MCRTLAEIVGMSLFGLRTNCLKDERNFYENSLYFT